MICQSCGKECYLPGPVDADLICSGCGNYVSGKPGPHPTPLGQVVNVLNSKRRIDYTNTQKMEMSLDAFADYRGQFK